MGLAFDGTGGGLSYNIASPSTITAGTMCCWFRPDATPLHYTQPMCIAGTTTSTDYNAIAFSNSSANLYLYPDSDAMNYTTNPNVMTLVLGVWVFAAVAWSGTSFNFYAMRTTDTAMTSWSGSASAMDSSQSAKYLHVGGGDDNSASYTVKGSVSGAKFWGVQLSATEVALERSQLVPVRRTNLLGAYPLSTDSNDWSGNGRTLTYVSTADTTWTDDPAPMFAPRLILPTPSPALMRAANW